MDQLPKELSWSSVFSPLHLLCRQRRHSLLRASRRVSATMANSACHDWHNKHFALDSLQQAASSSRDCISRTRARAKVSRPSLACIMSVTCHVGGQATRSPLILDFTSTRSETLWSPVLGNSRTFALRAVSRQTVNTPSPGTKNGVLQAARNTYA